MSRCFATLGDHPVSLAQRLHRESAESYPVELHSLKVPDGSFEQESTVGFDTCEKDMHIEKLPSIIDTRMIQNLNFFFDRNKRTCFFCFGRTLDFLLRNQSKELWSHDLASLRARIALRLATRLEVLSRERRTTRFCGELDVHCQKLTATCFRSVVMYDGTSSH